MKKKYDETIWYISNHPPMNFGNVIAWALVPVVLIATRILWELDTYWVILGCLFWADIYFGEILGYILSTRVGLAKKYDWKDVRQFCYIIIGILLAVFASYWLFYQYVSSLQEAILLGILVGQGGWLGLAVLNEFWKLWLRLRRIRISGTSLPGIIFVLFVGFIGGLWWGQGKAPLEVEYHVSELVVCVETPPIISGVKNSPCIDIPLVIPVKNVNITPIPTPGPDSSQKPETCDTSNSNEAKITIFNQAPLLLTINLGGFDPIIVSPSSTKIITVPQGTYVYIGSYLGVAKPKTGKAIWNTSCGTWNWWIEP